MDKTNRLCASNTYVLIQINLKVVSLLTCMEKQSATNKITLTLYSVVSERIPDFNSHQAADVLLKDPSITLNHKEHNTRSVATT